MNQENPENICFKIITTSTLYGTWNFSHNNKIWEWIKGIQTGKENVKLFYLTVDMILYLKYLN